MSVMPAHMSGVWEREGRNPLVGAFLLVLVIGGVYFLVQSLVLNGVILIDSARRGSPAVDVFSRYQWLILGVLTFTQYGLLLIVPLILIRGWHTQNIKAYLTMDRFHLPAVLLTTIGAVTLLPLVDLLARYLYSLVPGLESVDTGMGSLLTADSIGGRFFIYFAIAVTPAICEETLFRAYFQRTLERRLRPPWHFLISGTLFALFHQQVLTLPSLVLVGIYLSYMYYAFRSPWTTVAAHFAYNGIQVFLLNYNRPIPGVLEESGFTTLAVLAGTGVSIVAVLIAAILYSRSTADGGALLTASDERTHRPDRTAVPDVPD